MTKILTKMLDLSLYVNSKKNYFSSFSKGERTKTDFKKLKIGATREREKERKKEREY